MVVSCWSEQGKWRVDEKIASVIPGLRALMEEKKYGVEYVVYVVLTVDPLSPFSTFEDAKERSKMAANAVWGKNVPAKALTNIYVTDAVDEYLAISLTSEAKAMNAMKKIMDGVTQLLEKAKITEDNMDKFQKMADGIPKSIESYRKMRDKAKIEEGNTAVKVRGDHQLTWAEQKYAK